ncbi:MAG: replicative DNA helicase, partial [Cytophagaceae bacterium]
AKELNVPVIALSQLSRAVETRGGDKKPQLSDLRESGSIEQDADMVMFLYRPEYYNITQDEAGNSTLGVGEVIVAKNRSGSLDTIQLRFINRFTKFCDLDGYFTPVPGSFPEGVSGMSSFDGSGSSGMPGSIPPPGTMPPLPPTPGTLRSRANDLSNFGNADPSQETPF